MIRVGTPYFGYNERRNFIDLPYEDVVFKRVIDVNRIYSFLKYKLTDTIDYRRLNRFNDHRLNRVDLFHFFNTITPVRKPWVVTFETSLPRLDDNFLKGFEWLASPYCKRIFAMSDRAFRLQSESIRRFPELQSAIANKMEVLIPAQEALVDEIIIRSDQPVTFTFAGSAFFRKGGWEMLKAFSELKKRGLRFNLNVVSNLSLDGFMDIHATEVVINETKEMLRSNWVSHYPVLSNAEVLLLFKNSDVGILPSYSETFGYSLLEAMACGCAVITPRFSPFTEFIDESCGWFLKVPSSTNTQVTKADLTDPVFYSRRLIDEIKDTVEKIIQEPAALISKRQAALVKIKNDHQPATRAHQISQIYREVLN